MHIIKMPVGSFETNSYILYDKKTKEGVIIDPGFSGKEILKLIREENINIRYIILTHGHGDHIGAVNYLKEELNVKIVSHKYEKELLQDSKKNMSSIMGLGNITIEPDFLVEDGNVLKLSNINLEIIHTPGHTKGGISIKVKDHIFTGDTIFQGSIGRTDFIGGNMEDIIYSIKNKLLVYDNSTILLPGHGENTTVGYEKKYNPFIR